MTHLGTVSALLSPDFWPPLKQNCPAGRRQVSSRLESFRHQFLEAREGVKVTKPTTTVQSISYPKLFEYFDRISGMTGTAHDAADELWEVYNLSVRPTRGTFRQVVQRSCAACCGSERA